MKCDRSRHNYWMIIARKNRTSICLSIRLSSACQGLGCWGSRPSSVFQTSLSPAMLSISSWRIRVVPRQTGIHKFLQPVLCLPRSLQVSSKLISQAELRHQADKTHFDRFYLRSGSFGHYPALVIIGEVYRSSGKFRALPRGSAPSSAHWSVQVHGNMVNALYLQSSFLVLMTCQSALQVMATHPFTHTFIQRIYGQHFFYEGQFEVQHLAQGHFGIRLTQACCMLPLE